MNRVFDWLSWLVTVRPWATLVVIAIVTLVLAAGITQRAPVADNEVFLPGDSGVARALEEIETLFRDSDVIVVTLVFRGEVLTPDGLAQMDGLLGRIVSDPGVGELLPPVDAVTAPTLLMKPLLQVTNFDSVTQAQIDTALDHVRATPELQPALTALDLTTGTDTAGMRITVATVRLRDTGDEAVEDAQLTINDLAEAAEGPLSVRSVSLAVIEEEYQEATSTGVLPLVGLALLVIAALTLLFMRTLSDLLLTLTGLVLALIWTVGAESWLGPGALDLIGPPNALTATVPIILIGLAVDYAIQSVSHYREQRIDGEPVRVAVLAGLRNVIVPLALAAATTAASFLANLLSPISGIGDFGVVAGLGIGFSLVVMLTVVPAARMIIDRRREARGPFPPPRPIAKAIPGVDRLAERLGTSITRRPVPYLVLVVAVTVGFGFAASGITTDFTIRDVLPRDGNLIEDLDSLDAVFGGSTEVVSVLVRAEVTETRTLHNLFSMTEAFEDDISRPRAADGTMEASLPLLVLDWTTDDGTPGDRYDPELERLFAEATTGLDLDPARVQKFLDTLAATDPEAVARVLVEDPEGIDTTLLQFRAFSGDRERTEGMVEDIYGLWFGDDAAIAMTSQDIIVLTSSDEIRDRQTEAIIATIAAAFAILTIFFWITLSQPALGSIAVGPIVLVLIWVLGTMALLGIPYTIVTSITTVLAIGVGVDYTIHMIHRYREEFAKRRNPETAAIRTLTTTGSALLGSALTTALGFAVLTLSPLQSFEQFGITATITIAYALIVSILVVPPAMTVWGAYQNMRMRSMVERLWNELDVAIEDTHRRHEKGQGSS